MGLFGGKKDGLLGGGSGPLSTGGGLFNILDPNPPSIFDVIEAVTTDQKTEGKKEGYEIAAKEYEVTFRGIKSEYDAAIAEIKRQKQLYHKEADTGFELLDNLERKRDFLKSEVKKKEKQAANHLGVPVGTISGAVAYCSLNDGPMYGDIFRVIVDIKKRQRMKALQEGYAEAKALYEGKIAELRQRFDRAINAARKELGEYADLLADTMKEIEMVKMEIADLELMLEV